MIRRKLLLIFIVLTVWVLFIRHFFHSRINPATEDFTRLNTCPACYGRNLCPSFYHGEITLTGGSKLKYLKLLNRKNVYYGKLGGERVVLKMLAHDWEIAENDKLLCKLAGMAESCDVSAAIRRVISNVPIERSANYLFSIFENFNSSTDIAKCPSKRLFSYIYGKITGDVNLENMLAYKDNIAQIMYSVLANPESVILQAFTRNEGWPFPQFKGSCGRFIVVEYVGSPLLYFEDSSWLQRLDLSYQLLQIAQRLTDNSMEFALYLSDVTMDNFAVKPDGTLLLIDVENIIIVDRWKLRKDKRKGWDHMHHSKGDACKDCLNFSYEDLCTHDMSDHNYYAVCKGLLAPHSYYSPRGLLHSIPSEVERNTNLSALVKECADPTTDIGRFIVVPKLLQVMKSLL